MSLFGALFTGVSGLNAQSQSTAMVANNIANVSTVGFKRSEASFYSLVTSQGRSTSYSPGTTAVNRIQRVNQQGAIQQTGSSTDAAISGNGFFTVKREASDAQEPLYTRSGSFSEDADGLLRNTAGFVLYAWPLDSTGGLPANQGDLASLVPADVAFLGGLTRPTSSADISLNIDADEPAYNPSVLATSYPISTTQTAHFTRGLTVYDTLGSAEVLTFQFRHIVGPMANTTSATGGLALTDPLIDASNFPAVADGDQFTITTDDGTTVTSAVVRIVAGTPAAVPAASTAPAPNADVEVQTVGDLVSYINNSFGGGGVLQARLDTNGRLLLQTVDPGISAPIDLILTDELNEDGVTASVALFDANGFGFPETVVDGTETYTSIDIPTVYPSNDQTVLPEPEFPNFQNVTNANTQGWWEMTVLHPDGSILSEGLLNFNGDGTLNARQDANADIDLQLSNIVWGNGSDPQDISIDIERFSQFAGNYDVISSDQNGAELGLRTGVEITRDGFIVAQFSNGASANLYKVPLVTFANPDGLSEVSGTAYAKNDSSGEENLREAGEGGSGFLEPSTVEASNVDLADEFARLIVAQRAYSANTKIINTVDQMTEELLRLR